MKTISLILCILLFVGCNNADKTAKDNTELKKNHNAKIEGTWELVSFYNYQDNKVVDSFVPNEGYRQVKMYSRSKVMWSKNVPGDSTEWFGYGTYRISGDTLTEVLDYGSEMMKKIIAEKVEFNHELLMDENSFTQIEIDGEGNRIYAENYKRIE